MVLSGFTDKTFPVPTRVSPFSVKTDTEVGGKVIGAKTVITRRVGSCSFSTVGMNRSMQ